MAPPAPRVVGGTRSAGEPPEGATLSTRALNRALLQRQMLLERVKRSALEAVEHLVGMQAQNPKDPYIALWSRLEGFEAGELEHLLHERQVARSVLQRGTVHLATASDCLQLRPLVQPLLTRIVRTTFTAHLGGADPDAIAEMGRGLLATEPRTFAELRPTLAARWPDAEPQALSTTISYLVPLVQVPPRGLWSKSGAARWLLTEAWLGQPLAPEPSADRMVLRYLAAFGPASVSDIRTWCGVSGLREVVERLRPSLVTFRDEQGRELLDLPDAPRPHPDTPAPPRFLPEYDNVFLSHAERARIVDDNIRRYFVTPNGRGPCALLIDGFVAGAWKIEKRARAATLHITPLKAWSKEDHAAVTEEGERLLAFVAADARGRDIRVAQVP